MVLFYVNNNLIAQEDLALIGGNAVLKLDPYNRGAALEYILEESPYEMQRYVILDGLDNIRPEDSVVVITKSGKQFLDYLRDKIGGIYNFLFTD